MALYGVDFYGASRYGPRVFLDFDARPLRAQDRGNYNQLSVTWTTPAGQWSVLRLVRNAFGTPVNQDDGAILVDSRSGPAEPVATRQAAIRTYLDTLLEGGRFQYYAIFVYVPSVGEWTRAAATTGLPLKDHGYSNRLWELTPGVYRTRKNGLLDDDNETLRSFLKVVGLQLDHVRAELETLRSVNDPEKVSGGLLPLMAHQYGQFFEPELGMKQMRRLLRDTVHLYRTKGTIPGIEGFVSAVSGYGAEVLPLKNLMLDYNDSSAEESIGRWVPVANASITRYVADGTISAAQIAGMRQVGIMKITSAASGESVAFCGQTAVQGGHLRLYGIPVTAGSPFAFSAYARSGTAGLTARTRIYWYDAAGNYISEATGLDATPTTTDWSVRPVFSQAAPAGAVYAVPSVVWTATAAGQSMYWDAMQFEPGSAATAFVDARLIDINALAPRVNHATNPNFESTAVTWSVASPTGTLTPVTAVRSTAQASQGSTAALHITFPAQSYPDFYQGHVNLGPDSGIVLKPGEDAVWSFDYRHVSTPPAGAPGVVHVTGSHGVTQIDLPASVGAWRRFSIPIKNSYDVDITIQLYFTPAGGTSVTPATALDFYVDSILVERGTSVGPYFDGSTYAFIGESLWEGTANLSRSHHYPQRRAKNYRLNALLPQYTPMGSSFRVNYAQPL